MIAVRRPWAPQWRPRYAEAQGGGRGPFGAEGRPPGRPTADRGRAAGAPASERSERFFGAKPPILDTRTLLRQTSVGNMSQIAHWYSGGEQQTTADRFPDIGGNAIVYTYPCGVVDIICASDMVYHPAGWEPSEDFSREGRAKPAPRETGKKSEGADMVRSMRRARANLRRLALANSFDYFVTLTLDPAKIDRYDPKAIMHTMNRWLDNMVRRHGLRYILVPERHKDGALHFHGFFSGDGLEVEDSGTIKRPGIKKPCRPRSEAQRAEWIADGGRVVYNLNQWPLGFTTALSLYGEYAGAVAYICKYVGKQEGERPMGRWYYSGGALAKPQKEYLTLSYRDLVEEYQGSGVELDTPGSKIFVVHTKGEL